MIKKAAVTVLVVVVLIAALLAYAGKDFETGLANLKAAAES
jgi:hypothetical protein